jgi:hypothetical protein
MTEEQIALARRAVACRGFRWLPGMLTTEGMRVVVRCFGDDNEPDDDIPDLTDPATLGCLLALVREARAVPFLQAENLVAALEAAP